MKCISLVLAVFLYGCAESPLVSQCAYESWGQSQIAAVCNDALRVQPAEQ